MIVLIDELFDGWQHFWTDECCIFWFACSGKCPATPQPRLTYMHHNCTMVFKTKCDLAVLSGKYPFSNGVSIGHVLHVYLSCIGVRSFSGALAFPPPDTSHCRVNFLAQK